MFPSALSDQEGEDKHMTIEQKKEYMRTWYLKHRDTEIYKAALRNTPEKKREVSHRLATRNRAYINKIKGGPCSDCKQVFPPCVMEFDHRNRNTKYNAVANMASSHWSLKKIQEEIDKCDLVCSNCHAIRTYNGKHFLPLEKVA